MHVDARGRQCGTRGKVPRRSCGAISSAAIFADIMKNIIRLAIVLSVAGGAFVAGVAVGQAPKGVKFVERSEVKMDDLGGPKLGNLNGDYKKGNYLALMQLPAGFTSPMHTHSGAYEAIQIEGTSRHWLEGEDGTKAKKMTPGSYWAMPAKLKHYSACEAGKDCVLLVIQKGKFDFTDATPKAKADPKAGSAAGSAAKPADPKAGSAAPKKM
jgi:quercetin dioxygenase-like cupin family protein